MHRALAQQPADKYQPHIEAGGFATNEHGGGDVDIFLPVWQDPNSLLFGDLRGSFTGQPAQSGSFGLGYRTQVDPEWILGGYGFFDLKHTDNDNTFYQGSVGLEALSIDWDFRVNGYFPFNGDSGSKSRSGAGGLNGSGLTIIGTDIGFHSESEQEKALLGVDGEVGWRVPIFPADGDMDLRMFAGGFYFGASDADTLAGPRGRIELRLYDLELLGVQSRLTAQGLVQWDDHRGTIGGGGLELRIPLGGIFGQPETKLSALDRRMADRVVRDPEVIETRMATHDDTRIQDVQVDGLVNTPTHKIVFADADGTAGASGAQGDETTLDAAPGKFPGRNEIIVTQGDKGDILVSNPVQLQDGQSLLGGGTPVGVTLVGGPDSGRHIIFTPPGTTPNVMGNDNTQNLIEMASGSQNRVTGLSLTGSFLNAIHGLSMYRAIITDNFESGGAADGVLLEQTGAGTQPSSHTYIARNVLEANAGDGIQLRNSFSDGQPHLQLVGIFGNLAVGNGDDGIAVATGVYDDAVAVQTIAIDNNRVADVQAPGGAGTAVGIRVASTAGDATSAATIIQTLSVTGNSVTGVGNQSGGQALLGFGVLVANSAGAGSTISQAATIATNAVANVYGLTTAAGIANLNVAAQPGAAIAQTIGIDDNTVDNVDGGGIVAGIHNANLVSGGASVSQALTIDPSTITDIGGGDPSIAAGILDLNRLDAGATLTQAAIISANLVSNVAAFATATGIATYDRVAAGGFLSQSLSAVGNQVASVATALSSGRAAGISVLTYLRGVSGSSGAAVQTVDLSGNIVDSVEGVGILARAGLTSATMTETTLAIDRNTVTNVSLVGIYASNVLWSGSVLTQGLAIDGNSIAHVAADRYGNAFGVIIDSLVKPGSFVSQAVSATGNQISDVSGTGVVWGLIKTTSLDGAPGTSASAVQAVDLSGNTISGIAGIGIAVQDVLKHATLTETTIAINQNTVTDVRQAGIYVVDVLRYGSTLSQGLTIDSNAISQVATSDRRQAGILVDVGGDAGTVLSQTVSVDGNRIANVASTMSPYIVTAGIILSNRLYGTNGSSASAVQSVDISNNTITAIDGDGIAMRDDLLSSASLTQLAVTISRNTISNVSGAGIYVGHLVQDSVLSQGLIIDGNDISQVVAATSTALGVAVYARVVTGGVASQTFAIGGNTVTDVQASGGTAGGISIGNAIGFYDVTSQAQIQTLSIAGNVISHIGDQASAHAAYGFGVLVSNGAGSISTITQSATIATNSVVGVYGSLRAEGIANLNRAATTSSVISQTLAIDDNGISSVHGIGIVAGIQVANEVGTGGLVSQALTIDPNTVRDIGGTSASIAGGVLVANGLQAGSTLSRTVDIASNDVAGVTAGSIANGIAAYSRVRAGALAVESIQISGNAVSGITASDASGTAAGISVITYALGQAGSSATVVQTLGVIDNMATGIGGYASSAAGIAVLNQAQRGAISQNLVVAYNSATGNAGGGILLANHAAQSGVILQRGAASSSTALIASNVALGNSGDGINLTAFAESGGYVHQAAYVNFNTAGQNGGAGLNASVLASGGVAFQYISAEGNVLGRNNGAGLRATAYGAGGTQLIKLASSGGIASFLTSNLSGVLVGGDVGTTNQIISLYSNLGGTGGPNVIQNNATNLLNAGTGTVNP